MNQQNDQPTDQNEIMMALMKQMMEAATGLSASPFQGNLGENGGNIIEPGSLGFTPKTQQKLSVQPLLDKLCLNDKKEPLGGLPKGSTIMFDGYPGCGKTRTCMEALLRAAASGVKTVYVVSEEGYSDPVGGRDDLHSRLLKMATNLDIDFKEASKNYVVLQSQYHRGQTWNDFVSAFRNLVEKDKIEFAIIDSLTGLDPLNNKTVGNLNALKTYNHAMGVTCLVVSQIKESGVAAGGNAVMHTADVVFHVEELSLSSKEMAAEWGGKYRDKVKIIKVIKSNTTPVFTHPVLIGLHPVYATLHEHPDNPHKLG